jgi:hypothetical protein
MNPHRGGGGFSRLNFLEQWKELEEDFLQYFSNVRELFQFFKMQLIFDYLPNKDQHKLLYEKN